MSTTMAKASPEGIHLVPTALGGVLVHTSNKHIVAATSTALAIPLSDTPCPEMEHYTVRYAHNSGLQRLMIDNGLTKFWRYARVTDERLPVPISSQPMVTQVLSVVLTCGLTVCFGDPPAPASADPRTNAATAWKQRGYYYECVLEIPGEANEMLEHFDNVYGISNYAAGTAAQGCLWMHSERDKSDAPGGGWMDMTWDTAAIVRHDYLWLYLYGGATSVRKIRTASTALPRLVLRPRD